MQTVHITGSGTITNPWVDNAFASLVVEDPGQTIRLASDIGGAFEASRPMLRGSGWQIGDAGGRWIRGEARPSTLAMGAEMGDRTLAAARAQVRIAGDDAQAGHGEMAPVFTQPETVRIPVDTAEDDAVATGHIRA